MVGQAKLGSGATSGSTPPSEFVRQVRDALLHLHDPAHLLRHPLNSFLCIPQTRPGDLAQNLRDALLDAIESLEPPRNDSDARAREKDERPYQVLMQRYVGGYSTEEIVARLHVSPRQFRREHLKGLQAVATRLWQFCRDDSASEPQTMAGTVGLEAELRKLGVQLQSVSLAELLASVQVPARALAGGYNISLTVLPATSDLACLCDRTLAKQAALSGLNALADSLPEEVSGTGKRPALQLAAIGSRRLLGLHIQLVPPAHLSFLPRFEARLAECLALMAAQSGSVRLVKEGDTLSAVQLLFQVERGARVLIVDDNDRMLSLYQRYLAGGNYQVTALASAQEAEAALAEATPDVIVLDVMMRDVDGWELLQRLRSRPELRQVPIIVCSVLNEPKLAQFLGAQAYLKKPVVAEDLLAALQRVLDESSPPGPSPTGP